jgi:DNA-binding response OmpR family regulator
MSEAAPIELDGDLRGVHILVVDDNVDARRIYKHSLSYAGAAVLVAASASAAVRTLRHVRPSVVLTDLSMPRKDGLWLIRWIRTRDSRRGRRLPVIAVSAHDDVYEHADTLMSGFDHYLVKPVAPADLYQAIRDVLRPASEPVPSDGTRRA